MNNFMKVVLTITLFALSAFGQTALTQTTLNGAIDATQNQIVLTSASGVSVGSGLYIMDPGQYLGELVRVTAVNSTRVTVLRGGNQKAHVTGSLVIIGPTMAAFQSYDPSGRCTASATLYTPWINTTNGRQWLCSSVTGAWVPGFGNTAAPPAPTVAVASAAAKITPSGPLFHVTGTAAVTGFNRPVGFNGGTFCAIPDAIFTTTTANEIALASTAVVSRTLCWTADLAAAKPYFPSY